MCVINAKKERLEYFKEAVVTLCSGKCHFAESENDYSQVENIQVAKRPRSGCPKKITPRSGSKRHLKFHRPQHSC